MAAIHSRLELKMESSPPTDRAKWDEMEAAVEVICDAINGGVPTWNNRVFTYVGSTNNVDTITYKYDSTTVAVVTYTYVASGAADDDQVASETIVLS